MLTSHNVQFYGSFPVNISLIFKKSQIRRIFMFQLDTLTLVGEIISEGLKGGCEVLVTADPWAQSRNRVETSVTTGLSS